MINFRRAAAIVAVVPAISFIGAGSAWATDHSDPCPGQHIQVWADLGGKGIDNGGAEATDHFVCSGDLKGDKGDTGAQGPAGPAGADGAAGAVGAQGEAGLNGADGSAGADGAAGPAGADGAAGAVGPIGAPGLNGLDGTVGANGHDGLNGKNGKNGVTKTVVVNADGTQTVIDGLPHTGASNNWLFAIIGLGCVTAGTATVLIMRRP